MVGGAIGGGAAANFQIQPESASKKKDGKKAEGEEVNLESPTSVKMKTSLLIKHADPSFDVMAAMKKKKSIYNSSGQNIFGINSPGFSQKTRNVVQCNRPMPRDGHTGINFNQYFLVFGGDRHHMPFNDFFVLDLESELDQRFQ